MPKITINGKEMEFEPGQTVMEVARANGIDIPHYCWHPQLSIDGCCRMCQVEIHGPGPQRVATACNNPCADGMVVETESDVVSRTRAGVLEGLLLNHPLDCAICDKAGECWLQDYAYEYGAAAGRQEFPRRKRKKRYQIAEHVILDQERCILCTRCVRFLHEFARKGELGIMGRGDHAYLDIFPGQPVSSEYQGNLADICPVGALTLTEFRHKLRVWFLDGTDSVCPSCSRGCSISLDVHENMLYRVRPRVNMDVNGHFICDIGRFGLLERYAPESRIEAPAVHGETVALEAAASAAAEQLTEVAHAGRDVLVMASPDATNEELFLLKKTLGEAAGDLAGKATLAFRSVPDEGGDEILQTGQKAANVAGLKALGFEELSDSDLATRLGGVGALYLMDGSLEKLDAELDLLIVQAVSSPLAARADILLPGSMVAEKEGTLTNFAGITQRIRAALRPPQTVPGDLACLVALGTALGLEDLPGTPGDVFMAWADSIGADQLTLAGLPAGGINLADKT